MDVHRARTSAFANNATSARFHRCNRRAAWRARRRICARLAQVSDLPGGAEPSVRGMKGVRARRRPLAGQHCSNASALPQLARYSGSEADPWISFATVGPGAIVDAGSPPGPP
jgi:hypothetical protein